MKQEDEKGRNPSENLDGGQLNASRASFTNSRNGDHFGMVNL